MKSFLFFGILLLTFFIYVPGLTGSFHLDDYSNLIRLAQYEPLNHPSNFNNYLSVTRPLSFLSFLINDFTWPSTPYGFIYTNILFHLITGCLLIWLSLKAAIVLKIKKEQAEWIALLTGAFWLLHPLMVSTTLYVVQRMTILSALFVIASLISYIHGRELVYNNEKKGYWWLIPGVIFFSGLAYASKENAALIPIFLLLFELFLFPDKPIKTKLFFYLKCLFIYIPVLILIIGLFYIPLTDSFQNREFVPYERLLTQFRVLSNYLFLIFLPKIQTSGLYYENYQISKNLINPASTIISIVFIFSLLFLAYKTRKKVPIFSLAIFFYFAGHLMESTALNLELFFEHRNYLPSIFIFFALAYYIIKLHAWNKKLPILLSIIILCVFSSFTYSRVSLWGHPLALMQTWAEINSTSARIYRDGNIKALKDHRPDIAAWFLQQGLTNLPDNVVLRLQLLSFSYPDNLNNQENIHKIHELLSTTHRVNANAIFNNLQHLINLNRNNLYQQSLVITLHQFIDQLFKNPNYSSGKHKLYYLSAQLHLVEKSYQLSYQNFINSFLKNPRSEVALQYAALLASHKQYHLALKFLQFAKAIIPKFNKNTNCKYLEKQIYQSLNKA